MNKLLEEENSFIKAFVKLGFVSFARPLASVIKMKYFTLIFGAAGLGVLAQGQLFLSLLYNFGSFGLGMAIIKYLSEKTMPEEDRSVFLQTAFLILGSFAIIQLLPGLFFRKNLTLLLFNSEEYGNITLLLILFIPILIFSRYFEAILNADKLITLISRITISSLLLSLFAFFIFTHFFGIFGAVLALLIYYLFQLLFYGSAVLKQRKKKQKLISRFGFLKFDKTIARLLIGFGSAHFMRGVLTYFALLFFRVLIIQNHGLEANGFYQGGWSLSSYIITIFQSLVIYVLPTISALIQKPEELNREFSEIFHQILILISVAVIFTMIFSSELLMILYTSEFQSAKGIANILIFAQFFSVINLFVSTVVMSLGKLKHFVIIDVGRFLFPLLVVTILPRIFSITLTLENFAMAVLSGQILFFIYAMRYIYTLGIKIGKRSLFLLLRVVFFLLFLILFLMRFDSLWMAIGFFPIAFLIIGPASFREILSKLDFMRGQY